MKTALIISVSALALVACSNETSGDGGIQIAQVDETTAASALEALHLADSGEGAVSWESRTFDGGIYTFNGLTFTMPEDADDDDSGEEGELTASTNTFTADTMTLAGPRFDDDGNVVFDRLAINTIALGVDDDDFDGTISSFIIEEPNSDLALSIAHGFSGDASDDDDFDTGDWTYGLFALEDLNIIGTDDENVFTVSLGRFVIDDLSEYSIAHFELMDFVIEGADDEVGIIEFRLDEMSADGIGQALTYPFAAQFAMMGTAMSGNGSDGDITEDVPELPEDYDPLDAYDRAAIRGLNANIGGIMIQLDSLTAETREDGNNVRYVSEMTPLIITPDSNYTLGAQMAMGLGMLSYDQLEFVAGGSSVYDRDADRAYTDGENYFEMRDGFRIEVDSDMTGLLAYSIAAMQVGYSMDEPDPAQIMTMLEPLILNNFSFRLQDESLLDRALTAASAMQGMPKDQLRMQAGAMIALGMMGAPAEIPRPLLTEFSTAMTTFIANGGSVEVNIAPDQPVSVAELVAQAQAGNLDYEAMGISITAIPPEGETNE